MSHDFARHCRCILSFIDCTNQMNHFGNIIILNITHTRCIMRMPAEHNAFLMKIR